MRHLLLAALLAGAGPARAADRQVTIDNFTFSPATLTVSPQTRIVWINRDDIPHTVVSTDDAHLLKSPPLDTNDRFAFTFHKPGTYHYFCSIHPHMQGTVIVSAAAAEPSKQ